MRANYPAGPCRKNDAVLTSMRRNYVASVSIRHQFSTKCLLGISLRSRQTPLWKLSLSRKANKKSQKLLPFEIRETMDFITLMHRFLMIQTLLPVRAQCSLQGCSAWPKSSLFALVLTWSIFLMLIF